MSSVGFIGGGRVTRILAAGWRRADALPAQFLVHHPDPHAIEALRAVVPNIESVAADVVDKLRKDARLPRLDKGPAATACVQWHASPSYE